MTALTTALNLVRGPGVSYQTPPEVRRRYHYLYQANVERTDDGGATFHNARLWRRDGVNVLHLKGDRFEMAFQHGRLLRAEIAQGTLSVAAEMGHQGIRNSVGAGPLAKLVGWYADSGLAETMLRVALERARERGEDSLLEGYGLSEGSGLSLRTILRAPLGPEVAQILLGKTGGMAVGADPSQCTSFTAWGSKTSTGEVIIGRNTDYPMTGYYDAHPTVIYFEPTDGAKRYMTVTSAGCHNAGACGINEDGLYLATHTVPAASVSEEGFPVLMVGQQVLREASTLDEAAAIIDDAKPGAAWNYHVVSVRERKAMTFELSCARIGRLPSAGEVHTTTNHWRLPEMAEHHLFINQTVEQDTRARMERCVELIDEADGALDAAAAAAILGDKRDRTTGRMRSGPNVVSASTNVSSSVWLPASGQVFVANGRAPVSQNTYVEMPTLDAFDPATFAARDYATIDNDHVRRSDPQLLEAEQSYQRAREAFEHNDDAVQATALMAEAVALDGDNPALHLHHAMYAIRADRFDDARRAVDAVIAQPWDAQRVRVARYLRARLAAHDGDMDGARRDLAAVIADEVDAPRVAAAARKIRDKLGWRRRLRLRPTEISPMSWLPDAFRYCAIL